MEQPTRKAYHIDSTGEIPNSSITLLPPQIEPYNWMCDILMKYNSCINVSPLGAGKTVMTLAFAAQFNLEIVVICPKIVMQTWIEETNKYGLDIGGIMTYSALTSNKDGFIGSGMFYRYKEQIEISSGKFKTVVQFTPTKSLIQYAKVGTLFVFDESSAIKNPQSLRNQAATVITELVKQVNTSSRVIFLSGSPADKPVFAYGMARYLGVTSQRSLMKFENFDPKANEEEGLSDLIEFVGRVDTTYHNTVLDEINVTGGVDDSYSKALAYELMVNAILPEFRMFAPPPMVEGIEKDFANGFYDMSNTNVEQYVGKLKRIVEANAVRGDLPDPTEGFLSQINKALQAIEAAKMPVIFRLAKDVLDSEENAKIVVFCWYNQAIYDLYSMFDEGGYSVNYINGPVSSDQKIAIIKKFMQENNDLRVVIINAMSGSSGISLDDRSEGGLYPRYCYAVPSYRFIDIYQSTGRVYRQTTTSNVTLRLVYSENREEEAILRRLAAKSDVTRAILGYGDEDFIQLPVDYAIYEEKTGEITYPDKEKRTRNTPKRGRGRKEKEVEVEEEREPGEDDLSGAGSLAFSDSSSDDGVGDFLDSINFEDVYSD